MNPELINDPEVRAIAKAIAYAENGGAPNIKNPSKGKTGEMKSIYQFTPATWKNYSKELFGEVVPMNEDTETAVVMHKVKNWLDEDKKQGLEQDEIVRRIASRWNAGTGEPDAHDGTFKITTKTHKAGEPSRGLLKKYGNVPYDVPKYADTVSKHTNQFLQEEQQNKLASNQPPKLAPEEAKVKMNFLKDKLVSLLSGGVQKASAMEQPDQTRSVNMPLLGTKPPVEPPVQTETSANMKGLLGSSSQ